MKFAKFIIFIKLNFFPFQKKKYFNNNIKKLLDYELFKANILRI